MSVATGIIRDGRLVLQDDEEPLPEGRRFTVVIEDDDEDFQLDESSLKLLLESQASIRRGNFISAEQMLKALDDA